MIEKLYLCSTDSTDPYRNLAMEQYLLEHIPQNSCILYLWQNKNTVVIGRNQNAWVECRTTLLEQEGGKLARRLSGGGAVYHDLGNLNFTFLMCEEDYHLDRQLSVIQTACAIAGIAAERSGRNDLLVQGHKFSGNAFYHSQGHAYHHGTLLVSSDLSELSRYLTPSKAKREAKGVASVRSRVANLQEFNPELTCQIMKKHMETAFGQVYELTPEYITLQPDELTSIENSAAELGSWQWLYGTRLPCSFSCESRFPWGGISVELQVQSGLICSVQVYTDAMEWTLADSISDALTDCRFSLNDMQTAVAELSIDTQIASDICQMLSRQDI